jgi:hypothetical protein
MPKSLMLEDLDLIANNYKSLQDYHTIFGKILFNFQVMNL